MLKDSPEHHEEVTEEACLTKDHAHPLGRPPAGHGTSAPGQPGRAIQEVRQAWVPLRQGSGAWTGDLPLGDPRTRKDQVVLRSQTLEQAGWSVPRQLSENARDHRRDHSPQPRVARGRQSRRPWRSTARSNWSHLLTNGPVWTERRPAGVSLLRFVASCRRSCLII